MKELSLNILDISHNSIKAGADTVKITVTESTLKDTLEIEIADNGSGMDSESLQKVIDPFFTTRTTRKVGLGIPLLRQHALDTQGSFDITSKLGKGTTVKATFKQSHLDRAPLGDVASTITSLIVAAPCVRYVYTHITDDGKFVLDTDELKAQLDSIPLETPEILLWISEYIKENLQSINGGKI